MRHSHLKKLRRWETQTERKQVAKTTTPSGYNNFKQVKVTTHHKATHLYDVK